MSKPLFTILLLCSALFLTACVPPSHAIRINESLPKNAPIEKESVVTYARPDCPKGECSLQDEFIVGHSEVNTADQRQIEFYRYSRMTCDIKKVSMSARDYKYYVVWHYEGVPYRVIEAFCDEKSQEFRAFLLDDKDKQRKELPVLKNSGEWVIEVK